MRRIRTAAATVMVAAGLIGAVAIPASAARPLNYGGCVTGGLVNPATSTLGPDNSRAEEATQDRGGAFNGFLHSGGKARFVGACASTGQTE